MPEILITVRNKLPVIVGSEQVIVADNADYTIRFVFDDLWEEGEKTVYFVRNGYVFEPQKTVDDCVSVPVQVGVDLMSHLLVGVQQGSTKTSRPCSLAVFPSIKDAIDDGAVQPEKTLWEMVLERIEDLEKNGGGGSGGIFVGSEEDMPEGTVIRFDPNGRKVEIPQIDDTLTKEGFAADAKAVGDALADRLSVKQGIENAGKLLFVNADGTIAPLMIGAGLKIQNGVLIITNAAVTAAVCGEFLCGEVVCGGTR